MTRCSSFSISIGIDVKLSELLCDQHDGYAEYRDLAGLTITQRDQPEIPEQHDPRFTGELYLLTSPHTYSSASDFAAVVKDYRIGRIIGEETGGRRQNFGEVLTAHLPLSGIPFGVSCKVFYAPVPASDDVLRGTQPDVSPDEQDLAEYGATDDPLLYFALDYVRNA